MRLGMRSLAGSARHLFRIEPQISRSGLPRRPRLVLLALQNRGQLIEFTQRDDLLLIDANANKEEHARREFCEQCVRIHPLEVKLALLARIVILLAVGLPRRLMVVVCTTAMALNLRRQLPNGSRVALYNPQHFVLYAVSEVMNIEKVFQLAPEYPRIRNVRFAYACTAAHEILGYPSERQCVTIQPYEVVEDHPVIRIYLSQLAVVHKFPEDAALVDFVRWVRARVDVPIEIFLHYIDRDVTAADERAAALLSEIGELVRRDASLQTLSSKQVSFSGSSSIGYDLLSSEICHVMVVDRGRWESARFGESGKRLAQWRTNRPDVIRYDASCREWLEALQAANADCFRAVFKRPLEDVVESVRGGP